MPFVDHWLVEAQDLSNADLSLRYDILEGIHPHSTLLICYFNDMTGHESQHEPGMNQKVRRLQNFTGKKVGTDIEVFT